MNDVNDIFREINSQQESFTLTKAQQREIQRAIKIQNYKRARMMFITMFLFEVMLVVLHDLPALRNEAEVSLWVIQAYLVLHILIGLTVLAGFLYALHIVKKDQAAPDYRPDIAAPVITALLISFLSIITALDQIQTNQIIVFLVALIVPSVIVIIKPPWNYVMYAVPYSIFMLGMLLFQGNKNIMTAHMINGSVFFVCVLVISKLLYDNQVSHLIKNIKLEEANQKLSYLSSHDPLTTLTNRLFFENHIYEVLPKQAHRDKSIILLLMDIDHFKQVNENPGHPTGDLVLQEFSEIILSNVREGDIAARWGGEEFLVMLADSSLEEGEKIAERLRKNVADKEFNTQQGDIRVTISIGVAPMILTDGVLDFECSYQHVDKALYQAKEGGRNRVVVFDDQVDCEKERVKKMLVSQNKG